MKLTVKEIAALVEGEIKGEGTQLITGVAGLSDATASDISFLKDPKKASQLKDLEKTKAGAVIVPEGLDTNGRTVVVVENPLAAFSLILQQIQNERPKPKPGIHTLAYVDKKAKIGQNVTVGPHCIVEEGAEIDDDVILVGQVFVGSNVKVGKGTKIFPQAVLRENIIVGQRCIIHAGAVIGSDGYGFYFSKNKHNKIPQIGNVVVEDDVEIGSCTTIDRATTGSTIIRKGAKIDNLVQVAHNVEVGENCLLVAQVGIAGSTRLGTGVVLAGQVGVADHVHIADGTQVGAQSGIKDNTKPGSILFGSPAQPIQDTIKQMLLIQKLPTLFKDMKKLKEKMISDE